MIKRVSIIVIIILTGVISFGQDFTFSQFYEMPLLRNPALAGINNSHLRIQTAHRSQWGSVTVPFQTQALSGELKFPLGYSNDYLTVGLQITSDVAGDSKLGRVQMLPVITFHKSLDDDEERNRYLSFAVMGGLIQSQFDPTKMTFDDQFQNGVFDPGNPTQQTFTKTSLTYGDLSTGLAYSNKLPSGASLYFGVAGYHLLKSKVSFYNQENVILKPRFLFNAGINLPTSRFNNMYLYGDYIRQGGARQLLAGLLFKHKLSEYDEEDNDLDDVAISVGAAYRWADALIPIVRMDIKKVFIGTSYDVNISKLRAASQFRGGFEITAGYKTYLNIMGHPDANGRTGGGYGSTKCPYF